MTPSISIVLTTMGRPSLKFAIASVACQLRGRDQLILATDGPCPKALAIADAAGVRYTLAESDYHEHGCGHRCGNAARDFGMRSATADVICFLDDDDTFTPNAIATIRQVATDHPDVPLIFKMIDPAGRLLWRDKSVRRGNVGTPMIVVPNVAEKLGRWGLKSGGDFDFAASTVTLYPHGSVVWREEIVCWCRAS